MRLILILLLGLNLFACQKFENQYGQIGFLCGLDPGSIEAGRQPWIIQSEDFSQLEVRFISEAQAPQPLSISSKGCVFAPAVAGVVQVLGQNSGVYASIQQTGREPALGRILLKKKYPLDLAFRCPAQGYFSGGELPAPLQINSQGSLEAVNLRLSVLPRDQKPGLALITKPFGETALKLATHLVLPQLADGAYDLQLIIENTMESWAANNPGVRTVSSCPLTVHRSLPVLRGVPAHESSWLLQRGDFLTVYAESPIPASVRFCREKLADQESAIPTDSGCSAQNICQDPMSFVNLEPKPIPDTGVYNYFFVAEDQAGNRSQSQCKRLVVSESAPHLEVQWDNPAWNIPLAAMETAAVDIKAKIALSHPILSSGHVLESLECRVDFTVAGKMNLRSSGVTCTSARCQGRDLSDWTPCDQDMRMSLSRFWAKEKAQRMAMHLHVRARAAATQVEEAQKTIWIYPQRFEPQEVSTSGFSVHEADDQSILLDQAERVLRWDDEVMNWTTTDLPAIDDFDTMLRVVEDKAHSVFAVRVQGEAFGAFVWKDKHWQPLPTHPDLQKCNEVSVIPHPGGGFLCETKDSILMWQDQRWQKTDLPCLRIEAVAPPEILQYQMTRDGLGYLLCNNGHIFQRRGADDWTLFPGPPAPFVIARFALNEQEHIWTQTYIPGAGRDQDSIHYRDSDGWHQVDKPVRLGIQEDSAELSASNKGLISVGDAVWDTTTRRWVRPSDLEAAFPDLGLKRAGEDARGELWRVHEGGFVLRTERGLRHFPAASFGVLDLRDRPLYDSQGRLWFTSYGTGSVYRIDPIAWHIYGEEAGFNLNIRPFVYSHAWLNPLGAVEYYEPTTGLIQSSLDQWIPLQDGRVPDRPRPLEEITADAFGHRYGIDASRKLYYFDGNQPPELIFTFPESAMFIEGGYDPEGHLWVTDTFTHEVWMLDGRRLVPRTLPIAVDEATRLEWFPYPDHMGVRIGAKLYLWDNAHGWMASSYDPAGRFGRERWEVAGPQQYVGRRGDGWVFLNGEQETPLPEFPDSGEEGTFKYVGHTLLFLSSGEGLYCLRDGAFQPMLTRKILESRGYRGVSLWFSRMLLDPYNRLWLTGSPFRMLRVDLGDPTLVKNCLTRS